MSQARPPPPQGKAPLLRACPHDKDLGQTQPAAHDTRSLVTHPVASSLSEIPSRRRGRDALDRTRGTGQELPRVIATIGRCPLSSRLRSSVRLATVPSARPLRVHERSARLATPRRFCTRLGHVKYSPVRTERLPRTRLDLGVSPGTGWC